MMESVRIENGQDKRPVVSKDDRQETPFTRSNPWIQVLLTLFLAIPVLSGNALIFYNLFGKLWTSTPFIFHVVVSVLVARSYLCDEKTLERRTVRLFMLSANVVEIILFAVVYPLMWNLLANHFFTEPDGTDVIEWSDHKRMVRVLKTLGIVLAFLRALSGTATFLAGYLNGKQLLSRERQWITPLGTWSPGFQEKVRHLTLWILYIVLFLSGLTLLWSLVSLGAIILPLPGPTQIDGCDPLDETECAFPFPSFHHMKPDVSSTTGWRLNLRGEVLPKLRSGTEVDVDFLNELDGFSTMAPLQFYMTGLKEAHEAGIGQLKGIANIADSVTSRSATLLVDVKAKTLVAHSAEIDYVDPKRPSVLVFPAAPLQHNTHYALAVVNATDLNGKRLKPTRGMKSVMADESNPRRSRYMDTLIPSLESAADFFSFSSDPASLQLLFDFQTISEESQLGSVRAVRDATIAQIDSRKEWTWAQHVRTVRVEDYICNTEDGDHVARTVHAELDVPWFLEKFGPGHRAAVLDTSKVEAGRSRQLGVAKFVVSVPCSVRSAALGSGDAKPIRAVMEYGHSLLATRNEALDWHLNTIADDEGYVIVAMDWRGMSRYDLLVFAKIFLSKPLSFRAARDNLIQGFANKYALQHFVQHEMFSMDWFSFSDEADGKSLHAAPFQDGKPPSQVFYGMSMGGIFGAGYAALSGVTGLINRAILGVPSASFAFASSRSAESEDMYQLARFGAYSGRHVRLFYSLAQMAWDSVEGSGVLAAQTEPHPPMIIQAGLGDASVPAAGAEALARALKATTLPNNPIDVYGVPIAEAANQSSNGPHVTLTELLYKKEYAELPLDNSSRESNGVHLCVRMDPAMNHQMTEFINTGRVVDPCEVDSCHREEADCIYWLNSA